MKSRYVLVPLVIVMVLAVPRPASARFFWSWLEEFSGPGPFTGRTVVLTGCFRSRFPVASPLVGEPGRPLPCVYFDKGWFDVERDDRRGFPEIALGMNDFGGSLRIVDGIDLGAGIGWISFRPQVAGQTEETHRKATVTPIRVVIRPLLVAVPSHMRRKMMGILSIYWKETYVDGPITGRHFGVSESQFHSNGELVRSFGIILDLTALVPGR
jgi:hypothetical protein